MQHYYTSFLASEAKCRSLSCSSFRPLGTEETAFTLSVIQHIVRVLVYLKLYPVRTTCQKRFLYLNVINRVSVNGKCMVAILLLGFKVLVRSQTYLPHIPIK